MEIEAGVHLYRSYLDESAQIALLRDIEAVIAAAPLYLPTMPRSGKPFSVRMTNCGPLGWVSDKAGYRYQSRHPQTREPWPAIPQALLAAWEALADYPHPPQACLVNVYDSAARMGLHQDRDEAALDAPILSISLGADCRFRLGGAKRGDPSRAFALSSGDALTLGGPGRLRFHGVDKILPEIAPRLVSPLLAQGGRVNLTLRRVG
ncbi:MULTISPECIES: alpha-ketoglutarate-dependent dioxygenase AlkB [Methylosinus]|uniref:Alpha-ketoglutarate-dependent dioxygenase AlkB n=1 Tax=Methylosinus trichosporium (strain ATCC 35070 / NCIMB 11131 / UNIQEM 75 / OB3b) TaxID=595536 RepID=A0A2D2D577_METT3|nr:MULTISPECIES: alpha-ketoglutarate-dependent dioxygenase AlkB [Methylosinus]ATQ70123.1 alpha-ketoglutarate-dependent dioxygenase AlkB [Methylosinus trichosporium OB3b]OBS54375.1 alkylated DNA repair dioxygenase [Methylosinus sp. 3S-1]